MGMVSVTTRKRSVVASMCINTYIRKERKFRIISIKVRSVKGSLEARKPKRWKLIARINRIKREKAPRRKSSERRVEPFEAEAKAVVGSQKYNIKGNGVPTESTTLPRSRVHPDSCEDGERTAVRTECLKMESRHCTKRYKETIEFVLSSFLFLPVNAGKRTKRENERPLKARAQIRLDHSLAF